MSIRLRRPNLFLMVKVHRPCLWGVVVVRSLDSVRGQQAPVCDGGWGDCQGNWSHDLSTPGRSAPVACLAPKQRISHLYDLAALQGRQMQEAGKTRQQRAGNLIAWEEGAG